MKSKSTEIEKNISNVENKSTQTLSDQIKSMKLCQETQTNSDEAQNTEDQTLSRFISTTENNTKLYNSEETQTIINASKYLFSTIDPETEFIKTDKYKYIIMLYIVV